MKEIGIVKKVYWKRTQFIAKSEDLLFIKVELLDRTGTYAAIEFDDEIKINTITGLLVFAVTEIEFENDFNEYSKILITAQLVDGMDSKINFEGKVAFANKLNCSRVYI